MCSTCSGNILRVPIRHLSRNLNPFSPYQGHISLPLSFQNGSKKGHLLPSLPSTCNNVFLSNLCWPKKPPIPTFVNYVPPMVPITPLALPSQSLHIPGTNVHFPLCPKQASASNSPLPSSQWLVLELPYLNSSLALWTNQSPPIPYLQTPTTSSSVPPCATIPFLV